MNSWYEILETVGGNYKVLFQSDVGEELIGRRTTLGEAKSLMMSHLKMRKQKRIKSVKLFNSETGGPL